MTKNCTLGRTHSTQNGSSLQMGLSGMTFKTHETLFSVLDAGEFGSLGICDNSCNTNTCNNTRICPGRHHAYNGALILAASLVATFEIKPSDTDPLPKFRENAEGISRVLMKSGTITYVVLLSLSLSIRV